MELNPVLRFFVSYDDKKRDPEKHGWLCFKHSISLSASGYEVEYEIGDFNSDRYMGNTWCQLCSDERKA